MFTSRAEFRVLLRQDNADIRLTQKSFELGLADSSRMEKVTGKIKLTADLINFLKVISISPDQINGILNLKDSAPINQKTKLAAIISRPHLHISDLFNINATIAEKLESFEKEIIEQAEINIKYEGYIQKRENKSKNVTLRECCYPSNT